jgi:hypothetical protein
MNANIPGGTEKNHGRYVMVTDLDGKVSWGKAVWTGRCLGVKQSGPEGVLG